MALGESQVHAWWQCFFDLSIEQPAFGHGLDLRDQNDAIPFADRHVYRTGQDEQSEDARVHCVPHATRIATAIITT